MYVILMKLIEIDVDDKDDVCDVDEVDVDKAES
jgi:hypothetical protein